jgi:hypothetical protein
LSFALFLLVCRASSCGVANDAHGNGTGDGTPIAFERFYSGFTPIADGANIDRVENIAGRTPVFLSENDWNSFVREFCPVAGKFEAPDFETKCLLAVSGLYGSTPSANSSFAIDSICASEGAINVKVNSGNPVYANNINGIGHLFVNVVLIDVNDLPSTIDVYTDERTEAR